MSLAKLSKSLSAVGDEMTSLTNKIIEHSKVFAQIAHSPLGAYLDQLTQILHDLHDPSKVADRVRLSQALVKFQNLLRLMFPDFDVTQYENAYNEETRPTRGPARRPAPAPSSGGGASGGMVIRIGTSGGKPTIDILNDSGGAGGTSWYKPDDPDYLKIQQSQGTLKPGH